MDSDIFQIILYKVFTNQVSETRHQIALSLGIIIRMFYNEHNPPHFHAIYNEFEAEFDIMTLEVVARELPNSVRNLW